MRSTVCVKNTLWPPSIKAWPSAQHKWLFPAPGLAIATLEGHAGDVYAVAFAPDGKTLASGSQDTTVRVYSAATQQEVERQLAR